MEPFSGVLVFINVLSDLHFNISSIASGLISVNLGQENCLSGAGKLCQKEYLQRLHTGV